MKLWLRVAMSEEQKKMLQKHFDKIIYEPWTETGERYYEDEMIDKLCTIQPDVLITELDKITEKVLEKYPHLKLIGDCRANPANVDIAACNKRNIPVICTPARNAQAVAELLVGLVICFLRKVIPSINWVKDKKWIAGTTPYFIWMGNELYGKKIGFVGFGAVGQSTAKILDAFGCNITYYDPFVDLQRKDYKKIELKKLFEESDIISIHLPVTSKTTKLINSELLSLMKKDALFVNTARTSVVDNDFLFQMLQEKKIGAAILDVLENEPPQEEDLKILKLDNVLLTPHICGATYEVSLHQANIIIHRFDDFFKNENLEHIVYNKEILQKWRKI